MEKKSLIFVLSGLMMATCLHSAQQSQETTETPKIVKAKELLKNVVSCLYDPKHSSYERVIVDPHGTNEQLKKIRQGQRGWLDMKLGHKSSTDLGKLTYEDLLALTTVIPEGTERHWEIITERYLDLYLQHHDSYGSYYKGPHKVFIMDAITDIRDEKIRLSSLGEQK